MNTLPMLNPMMQKLLADQKQWEAAADLWADQAATDSDSNFQYHFAKRKLAAIERSLQRAANGTFGRCDKCGKAIATERLEAIMDSESHTCIGCAQAAKPRHQSAQPMHRRTQTARRWQIRSVE